MWKSFLAKSIETDRNMRWHRHIADAAVVASELFLHFAALFVVGLVFIVNKNFEFSRTSSGLTLGKSVSFPRRSASQKTFTLLLMP